MPSDEQKNLREALAKLADRQATGSFFVESVKMLADFSGLLARWDAMEAEIARMRAAEKVCEAAEAHEIAREELALISLISKPDTIPYRDAEMRKIAALKAERAALVAWQATKKV